MAKADSQTLVRLIQVVEQKLAAIPAIAVGDHDSDAQHRAAAENALAELARDEGAKWRGRYDGHQLSMGGVKTSCTAGAAGVLRNWVTAARRRITEGFFNG